MSYALDTNGQNARFVRAAARYGDDPAVLKALAIGKTDPAGVVMRYQLAAEKLGTLAIRSAHKAEQYFEFPADIRWDRKNDSLVKRLAHQADVIHLNNSYRPYRVLGLRKPALLHHHGSLFRDKSDHMLAQAKARRMTQAVSTLDLTRPAPELLHWLPTAYDLDELAAMRAPHGGRTVRVVSAPTNRGYKSTEALVAAVDRLRAEGLDVELVLVEGKTWAECMAVKATADILFDQVAVPGGLKDGRDYPGGYGCNAVEAWGMGIPVVAGADDWTSERMRQEFGALPFVEATITTIADTLRTLVSSADERARWGAIGRAHAERFHAERPALARLASLYMKAIADYGDTRRWRLDKPARFEATKQVRYMDEAGQMLKFPVVTQDAQLAAFMRHVTARRNSGVVEVTE